MPVTAAAKDPGPIFTAVGVETFTGREWLVDEVDGFLATNPCGYVFVEAEAGLGEDSICCLASEDSRLFCLIFPVTPGAGQFAGRCRILRRSSSENLSLVIRRRAGCYLSGPRPRAVLSLCWVWPRSGHGRVDADLVLVVDGMDEAELSEDDLAFGLPPLLPDDVYVIGTYRTGHTPGRPDSPAVTVRISKADQRNSSDICEFLAKAVVEEVLAAKLAQAGMDRGAFTSVLAERCGGIWVCLRYVLQEVRLGLRLPDTIAGLPTGLRDYYADQIRRWQKDPAWNEALLPLLATLGVAGEPLPITVLARLAGELDVAQVRRWCDLTVRPLLTATRPAEMASPLRYEIYHSSFREVLRALPSEWPAEPGAEPSYDLDALADELQRATLGAHSRIADGYLTHFGGLDAGLPVLARRPAAAGIDGGYPLRHLAQHLQHAGREAELHALLAVAKPDSTDHEVNVWFAAHDHAEPGRQLCR